MLCYKTDSEMNRLEIRSERIQRAYVERSADAETEHDPGAEPRRGRHRGGQKPDRLRLGGVDVFFVHLAVLVDVQHDSRRFTHHSFEIFPLHVDDVVELEPSEEGVDGGEDHDGELGDGLTEDPNAEADDAGDAKLGAEELGELGEVDPVEEVLRFVLSALLTPGECVGGVGEGGGRDGERDGAARVGCWRRRFGSRVDVSPGSAGRTARCARCGASGE